MGHEKSKKDKTDSNKIPFWKKQLRNIDKLVIVIVTTLFFFFRSDLLVVGIFIFLFPYLILTKRKLLFYHLVVAFIVALIWMLVAKDYYSYNKPMISIEGISIYPLFAWTIGLFGLYLIYSHYEHKLKKKTNMWKIGLFTLIYWPLLIIFETLGYHVFGLKNMESAYPGLPICDCIHAAPWMQVSYFLLGIVFFTICLALKLENPHSRSL